MYDFIYFLCNRCNILYTYTVIRKGEILKKMMKIQLIINPLIKVTGFAFVYSERSDQPIIEGSMSLKAVKNGEMNLGAGPPEAGNPARLTTGKQEKPN